MSFFAGLLTGGRKPLANSSLSTTAEAAAEPVKRSCGSNVNQRAAAILISKKSTAVPIQTSHLQITDRETGATIAELSNYEVRNLRRAADYGDDEAALLLGMLYELGRGFPQSEKTTAQEMFNQGQEMFSWIPNAYIKYPCTAEGLRAAQNSVKQGMRVNMTLCFSQQQAAAVYAATKGTKEPAYVSPFVGRLDDIGQNGMDVVKNIKRMFSKGDGHVLVLAASIRSLEHLLYCFDLQTELATVPAKILEQWARKNFPTPANQFQYKAPGKPIPYEELDLEQGWEMFDIQHELTRKGVEKFAADYRATLSRPA
jgi:transaldolase